jgi:DNA-binding MarR family transcriptional regulator
VRFSPSLRLGTKEVMSRSDHASAHIAHHSSEEILAHPRFVTARTDFVDAVLALYEGDRFLTRLLLEAGRYVIFGVIMCFHAHYDEADRSTWPTMSLLKKSMAQFGLSSSRRVEALVARLVHSGFLELITSKQDRRVRILTPTEKMFDHDLDWLAAHYLPLHVLFPDPGYGPMVHRDRPFQMAQRLASMDFFDRGVNILASNPGFMLFLGRDAGVMVLFKLVQMSGTANEKAFPEISYADIGRRFGVSRIHVRELLRDAERAGFVRLSDSRRQLVQLTPAVMQVFDHFIADSMSGHDLIFQIASKRL